MGFVEGVLGKVDHLIENFIRHLLGNPPIDTAFHSFFLVAVHEILPLFRHHIALFLGHGTADQVTSSQRVAGQFHNDLHYLLLVDDTAVGGGQDTFQLRTIIADFGLISLSFNVFGNKIHGTRPVQGNARDDIFQVSGLELLHEGFHPGAFKLEHTLRFPLADHLVHFRVVIGNLVNGEGIPDPLSDHPLCVLDYRQSPETQEIHLEQTQFLDRRHGKLGRNYIVGSPGKGNKFIQRPGTDHDTRRVDGSMPWKSLQPHGHVDQIFHCLIRFISLPQVRVHGQGLPDRDSQFHGDHLCHRIRLGVREIKHPAHIPHCHAGSHGSEGDDLHHPVLAVLLINVIDHLLPSLVAEVDIDIRHGDTLRIQETLKDQLIPDRIDIRDLQTVGHDTPRSRSPAGAHSNPPAPGKMNKIPDDQKIIHITHAADRVQFIIQPGLQFFTHGLAVTAADPFLAQTAQIRKCIIAFRYIIGRHFLLSENDLHIASLRDLVGVLQSFRRIGEDRPHLFF